MHPGRRGHPPEVKAEIRELVRERVRLTYQIQLAAILRNELLETHPPTSPEVIAADTEIQDCQERLAEVTQKSVAERYGLDQNTITNWTTQRYR